MGSAATKTKITNLKRNPMIAKIRRDFRLSVGRLPCLIRGTLRRKNKRVSTYAGTICQRYFSNTRCITVKSTAKLGINSIQRDLLIDEKEYPTNLTNSVIKMMISNERTIFPHTYHLVSEAVTGRCFGRCISAIQ
jgi:hypothetical protein